MASSSSPVQAPPRAFHFMGICGSAMGAVAAMLRDQGYTVTGSDESVSPPMSTFLAEKGIAIQSGYRPENLPAEDVILVVGNTIRRGNPELEAALEAKRYYLSLPETLKTYFLRKTHNLVVTGTHGKTTTTSLLAWIFEHAGRKPSYLIGGLPKDLPQGCRRQSGPHWIIEGDEYDTAFFDKRSKFLHYLPELLIINNLEFDHADIFENLAAIQKAFSHLVRIVPRNGMVLVNADDANALVFRMLNTEFTLAMSGTFNVRNAGMAIAAAHFYQIPLPEIAKAVAKFEGVKRRQEVRGEVRGVTIIDDFGHHPTAMRETLQGLRHRFPHRRIWALFEPRSNTTRRAVFQKDLPAALSLADGVFVAQVAALEQIPAHERLHPEQVVADINAAGVPAYYEPDATSIVAKLNPLLKPGDVVIVFSNGGFGGIHQKLLM